MELASIYVGETARSLMERSGEHWRDGLGGKPECHMIEHLGAAHSVRHTPAFKFRVVRACKSALERQVRESVRIEMRGHVLNKKGVYNRCKLTRLVIDKEWDKKVWEAAWENKTNTDQTVLEQDLREATKKKREPEVGRKGRKKQKLEEGWVWGEKLSSEEISKRDFLLGTGTGEKKTSKLPSIKKPDINSPKITTWFKPSSESVLMRAREHQ